MTRAEIRFTVYDSVDTGLRVVGFLAPRSIGQNFKPGVTEEQAKARIAYLFEEHKDFVMVDTYDLDDWRDSHSDDER